MTPTRTLGGCGERASNPAADDPALDGLLNAMRLQPIGDRN